MQQRDQWRLTPELVLALAAIIIAVYVLLGEHSVREVVTIKETADVTSAATPPGSFREAAAKARRSVVNVYSAKRVQKRALSPDEEVLRRFYGLPEPQAETGTSLGSGVIVSADGFIVTNNHVIEGADEIAVVTTDGTATRASLVGADPDTDLAVLKINGSQLPAITFADSDQIRIGDSVLVIGNPFGVGQTVTAGIVSATGRNRLGINAFENFIQTDAPINPGNSGGALVDARGDLIGINTAIFSETGNSAGIGFAVPTRIVKSIMEEIIRTGRVERGWLGAELADVELAPSADGTGSGTAVVIKRIVREGPADRGGLVPRDVLKSVNGKSTPDVLAAMNAIAGIRPGQTAQLVVKRGNQEVRLQIPVGKRPAALKQHID